MPVARDRPAVCQMDIGTTLPFDAPNYFDLRTARRLRGPTGHPATFHSPSFHQHVQMETGKIDRSVFVVNDRPRYYDLLYTYLDIWRIQSPNILDTWRSEALIFECLTQTYVALLNVIIPLMSKCLIVDGKFFMKTCCNEIKSPSTDWDKAAGIFQ